MDLTSKKSKRCAMCFLVGFVLGFAMMAMIDEAKAEERNHIVTETQDLTQKIIDRSQKKFSIMVTENSGLNSVNSQDDWHRLQLSYGAKRYLFVSTERFNMIPGNIWRVHTLNLTGLGFGKRFDLTEDIRLFGQLGYYMVESDPDGRHTENEGLPYFLNRKFAGSITEGNHYEAFDIQTESGIFGGEIGLEYDYTKNLSFVTSLRVMKASILYRGIMDVDEFNATGACWENGDDIDLTSVNFGMSYKF